MPPAGTSPDQLQSEALRLHRKGDFEGAKSLVQQALQSNPDHGPSLVHMAVLQRNDGHLQESITLASHAVQVWPDRADGYIQLGLSTLAMGSASDAILAFDQAIRFSPGISAVHYNRALALLHCGRATEAKSSLKLAIQLLPSDARARITHASLLLAEEDLAEARREAELLIKQAPDLPDAQILMAKILIAEGKGSEAEQFLKKAVALDPNSSLGNSMMGFRKMQVGDFEAAEDSFRHSVAADPVQGLAYFGLTKCRKLKDEDRPLVDQILAVSEDPLLPVEQRSYLEYGVAKALDDFGDYQEAMRHYELANAFAAKAQYGESVFDESEYATEFDALIELYSREMIESETKHLDTTLPIFVFGMIRSGTTLTEQILSCHRDVQAAGEQWFWGIKAHLAENLRDRTLNKNQALTLAKEYCRDLKALCPTGKRITDKLPGNYKRIGLLKMLFPNAKFIHLKRNPVDTALSIFITANPTAPQFSHTKSGIVFAYRQYLRIKEHWRTVLPAGTIFDVQYEDLVHDREPIIRDMLAYLELDWDEACLSHEKNQKEVKTPSLWQVRQPMYSQAIDRWKRYEPWLGELAELLAEAPSAS